ncbi:hypothetical protein [Cellulosimicrobium cellulans]|uniref:hypothetical protein n=1 Tax=Cellulosimicrobium cellulans TaxID=1710 RepID=UPI002404C290|nr:hypothetical protein [Cellulosimicrobium cellulans]
MSAETADVGARRSGRGAALPEYGRGSVDRFDVAAELEASGFNERLTRLHLDGRSLFDIARTLHERRPRSDATSSTGTVRTRREVVDAVVRALVLVGGVVLAATASEALDLTATETAVASLAAWVGGQTTSAVVWARSGSGDLVGGVRAAGVWAFGVLVATGLAAGLTAHGWATTSAATAVGAFVGIQVYAQSVAILTMSRWSRTAATAVVVGAVAIVAARAEEASRTVVVGIALAVTAGLALVLSVAWTGASGSLRRRDLAPVPSAAVQALVLATGSLLLLAGHRWVDPVPFVAGTVVAVAVTDPALVLGRRRLQHAARVRTDHRAVGRAARARAVVSCALPAVLAVGVAHVAGGWAIPWGGPERATALVTAGYVALACVSLSLRAFGAPWLAAVAATPALVGAVLTLVGGASWGAVALFAGVVAGAGMLAARVTDPRSYL